MLNKYQILTLVILALLCVSCDKDNGASTKDTSGAASYNEQELELEQAALKRLPDRHRVGRRHNDKFLTL